MEKFYTPDIKTKEGFLEIQGAFGWSDMQERFEIIVYEDQIFDGWESWYLGKDAFRSPEEAADKARELRAKKIVSLKKQVAKLEALEG